MRLCYPQDPASRSKAIWVMDAFKNSEPAAIKITNSDYQDDISVFWGLGDYQFALIREHIKKLTPFIFTDMPYWNRWMGNNREACYWRVIPNALHCNWQADYPSDRFNRLNIKVEEWKHRGHHILVCPSSPTMSYFFEQSNWLDSTIQKLKKLTDRPIIVRHKPRNGKISGPMAETKSFADDCKNAWAVVTLCSLAGVEAACMGIPVFCHASSPCAVVGNLDIDKIEDPARPDRTQWLNTLAYHQYTEDEIALGFYKEILK